MSPGRFERKTCSISVEPMPSMISQPKCALKRCAISNPSDVAASRGVGAVYLPRPLTEDH